MSAEQDVIGVVETAAAEFQKMMDKLVSIFKEMQAAEKAAEAAKVQKELVQAIKDLKEEVAGLKDKPEGLTKDKVDGLAKKGEDLKEGLKNPAGWKAAKHGEGAPKMGGDGPLGLPKPGLPGMDGPPGLPKAGGGVPLVGDSMGFSKGGGGKWMRAEGVPVIGPKVGGPAIGARKV